MNKFGMRAKNKTNAVIRIWYFILYYIFGPGSIIYALHTIDREAGAHLPGHYTHSERYFVWIDYLQRRSFGHRCTFENVEDEYFKKWRADFEEAKKILDNRDMSWFE
jgi:hypothetical protein